MTQSHNDGNSRAGYSRLDPLDPQCDVVRRQFKESRDLILATDLPIVQLLRPAFPLFKPWSFQFKDDRLTYAALGWWATEDSVSPRVIIQSWRTQVPMLDQGYVQRLPRMSTELATDAIPAASTTAEVVLVDGTNLPVNRWSSPDADVAEFSGSLQGNELSILFGTRGVRLSNCEFGLVTDRSQIVPERS